MKTEAEVRERLANTRDCLEKLRDPEGNKLTWELEQQIRTLLWVLDEGWPRWRGMQGLLG